ncbi:hypothetical protein DSLASN_18460 [Desulfoluna limicola]|uniref:Uncharacterized protein n=1 Tax=Desulfoluna limicola TaxID=2810562 RepID=A0ABM7PG53_9BACT|nr:hypothetical protein DSLASN_18460 [Desulfoluna limicola]
MNSFDGSWLDVLSLFCNIKVISGATIKNKSIKPINIINKEKEYFSLNPSAAS